MTSIALPKIGIHKDVIVLIGYEKGDISWTYESEEKDGIKTVYYNDESVFVCADKKAKENISHAALMLLDHSLSDLVDAGVISSYFIPNLIKQPTIYTKTK
jgi:hypothetical protein